MPLLSVVVLAWEQVELTRRCVQAVRRHTASAYELIVVDNGSGPAARAYAREAGDVAVLHDVNRGFAAGMNAGLARASAPYVAFLNNDAVVPAAWDTPLLEVFSRCPRAGIVTPAVTVAGYAVGVRSATAPRTTALPPFRAVPSAVLYMLRTDVIRELGGWDERFHPAGAEDADLCFRIWVNHLDVVLDERVLVDHAGKGTATLLPDHRSAWAENRRKLLRKWIGSGPAAVRLASCPPGAFSARRRQARAVAASMSVYFATLGHLPEPVRRAALRGLRPAATAMAGGLARER